jgi:hypothetical protein
MSTTDVSGPRVRAALVALTLASAIAASTVGAAPPAKQQRVMLVLKHRFGDPTGTFTFHALSSGQLVRDAGSYAYAAAERPPVIRKGQGIAVYLKLETFAGRRGNLVVRSRIELVGAGNGATVGTGSWSLVRGTKGYAGVEGGGRIAVVVMTPGGSTSSQYEGLVSAPDRVR